MPPTNERRRLVKLVRDGVGQFLAGHDNGVRYERIDDHDEIARQLRKKLIEEAMEYVLEPSLGELADVWEVVRALALYDLGETMLGVETEALAKAEERGDFRCGIGMYVTTTAPMRHESKG